MVHGHRESQNRKKFGRSRSRDEIKFVVTDSDEVMVDFCGCGSMEAISERLIKRLL
jgi:hypothetical protein